VLFVVHLFYPVRASIQSCISTLATVPHYVCDI